MRLIPKLKFTKDSWGIVAASSDGLCIFAGFLIFEDRILSNGYFLGENGTQNCRKHPRVEGAIRLHLMFADQRSIKALSGIAVV